jgi:hypothetical protein
MCLEIVAPPCGWAATRISLMLGMQELSRSLHQRPTIGQHFSRVERGVYESSIHQELEPRQYGA